MNHRRSKRRSRITAGVVAAVAMGMTATAVTAFACAPRQGHRHWQSSWSTAPQQPNAGTPTTGTNWSMEGFVNQTVRQVVRMSTGGSHIRIRLSNLYGTTPLHVTGATVALSDGGAAVRTGTVVPLTFAGSRATTIRGGGFLDSDSTALAVQPLQLITVTLYFAGASGASTFHDDGLTTSYKATGDHRSDVPGDAFQGPTSHSFYYVTGVDVAGSAGRGTVVTFGDSITNGHNSTVGGDGRYSDALADRLAAAHRPRGVVNVGITGNLLLSDSPCFGDKGTARFRSDVLSQPGVSTVIFEEGTNDIWDSVGNYGCGQTPEVTAQQIIDGYRSVIRAAHARSVKIIGGTMLPFKAFYMKPEDFQRAEAIRDTLNTWIRTSGAFDGVVDFAKAVADPSDPQQLNPAFNSGDGLHPNDAGYRAMAAAVDLNTL